MLELKKKYEKELKDRQQEIEKLRKMIKKKDSEIVHEKRRRIIEEEEFMTCTQDLIEKLMVV